MELAQLREREASLDAVSALAAADLAGYYNTIAGESPPRIAAQLRVATPAVVDSYGEIAAVNAAEWYEEVRPWRGFAAITSAPLGVADETQNMLGWALAPLFTEDGGDTLGRVVGGTLRLVLNFDRATIDDNAVLDPFAGKSRRIARPDACAFCAYMSVVSDNLDEDTAKYHDHCRCYPVPFWESVGIPHLPYRDAWETAASEARNRIEADYLEKRKLAPDLRRRNFYRRFPETAINRRNILRIMRQELGIH